MKHCEEESEHAHFLRLNACLGCKVGQKENIIILIGWFYVFTLLCTVFSFFLVCFLDQVDFLSDTIRVFHWPSPLTFLLSTKLPFNQLTTYIDFIIILMLNHDFVMQSTKLFVFNAIRKVFFCVVFKNCLFRMQHALFTKQMQCTRSKVVFKLEHKNNKCYNGGFNMSFFSSAGRKPFR